MKTLLITRHAKAEKAEDRADIDRQLTERGVREASSMAQRLQKMEVVPDRLYHSPAERAKSTARTMGKEWAWGSERMEEVKILYPGQAEEILLWVAELPNEADRVMFIGHQPDLSRLVEILTGDGLGQMPPCSVACCEFETDDWNAVVKGSGHLKWSISPERN